MIRVRVRRRDVRRDVFCSGGPGGQNQNKVATGVRYTHLPTGVAAESRVHRTQGQNDTAAWEKLHRVLAEAIESRMRDAAQAEYQAKPRAAFGSQVRTYRLLAPVGVQDHRTGHEDPDVQAVLAGRLDGFLRAARTA